MTTTSFDLNQLTNFINAIVAAIPGAKVTCQDDFDHRPCGFELPGDVRAWLNYNQREHRISVSGLWPHSRIDGKRHVSFTPGDIYPRPTEYNAISISAAKNPITVAAEIQRRFLPGYRTVLARCLAARQKHEDYIANQFTLAQSSADHLDIALKSGDRATNFDLPKNLTDGSAYGSIEVSGNTVRFEVRNLESVSALKLIDFLKTL